MVSGCDIVLNTTLRNISSQYGRDLFEVFSKSLTAEENYFNKQKKKNT